MKVIRKKGISKAIPFIIVVFISVLGISFANVGNITGTIEVQAESPLQDGVFISNVEIGTVNEAYAEINTYSKRMLNTTVQLSETKKESNLNMYVTLYNNTNYNYIFKGLSYDEEFYDNSNITVEILSNENYMNIGDKIPPKVESIVYISFKYKDEILQANHVLNACINFEIGIPAPSKPIITNKADGLWINEPSEIAITSSTQDDRSKIEKIEYSYDNINWLSDWKNDLKIEGNTATINNIWNSDYDTTLYARAIDNFGEISEVATTELRLDMTLPKITFSAIASTNESKVTFSATAEDSLSGISSITASYKESNETNYKSLFGEEYETMYGNKKGKSTITKTEIESFELGKTYDLYMSAYDVAGNKIDSQVITVDVTGEIYAALYTDGTLALQNNNNFSSTNLSKKYNVNIGGKHYTYDKPNNVIKDDESVKIPWSNELSQIKKVDIRTKIYPLYASALFCNMTELTNFVNIQNLKTDYTTDMCAMFMLCKNLQSIDLSYLNTKRVTNMRSMFDSCGYNSMTSLVLPENFDTSNVTSMAYMFFYCGYNSLSELKLLSNFNTSKVTNMQSMFGLCGNSGLTEFNFPENFITSNVETMGWMFEGFGRKKIKKLELPNTFDTSKVTNMAGMFFDCGSENMTKLVLPECFDTVNVTNMQYMFFNCGGKNITELTLPSKFVTSKVTNMGYMFQNLSKITSIDISNFDTSKVTDMKYMFANCKEITQINVSKFNTSKVTTMEGMFIHCYKLKGANLKNFNTENVTNISAMFSGCFELENLDVSCFDTSKVIDMSYFCNDCYKITSLDLRNWDTRNVTNMTGMFSQDAKLTKILVSSKWKTASVNSGMFSGCGTSTLTVQ